MDVFISGIFYDTDFGNKDAPRRDQNTGIRCFPTNRPPFSSSYSISNIPGLNPGINENIQNSNVNKKSAASTEYLKLATQGGRKDLLHYEEFQRSATTAHNFHTFKVEEESDKENMRRHQHRLGNFTASNNSSNMNNNNIINNDNNTDNSNKLEIGDGEIPFVDQLVRNTNTTKVTRPDLLPVDNKAKLYFSYNRNDGKFSRIIVSPPRPFKFGGK